MKWNKLRCLFFNPSESHLINVKMFLYKWYNIDICIFLKHINNKTKRGCDKWLGGKQCVFRKLIYQNIGRFKLGEGLRAVNISALMYVFVAEPLTSISRIARRLFHIYEGFSRWVLSQAIHQAHYRKSIHIGHSARYLWLGSFRRSHPRVNDFRLAKKWRINSTRTKRGLKRAAGGKNWRDDTLKRIFWLTLVCFLIKTLSKI